MEKDKSECNQKYMITNEITIRDGKIISSACESCSDNSDATIQCASKVSCDRTWSRFYRSIHDNGITKGSINAIFANFYDPFINGLIRCTTIFLCRNDFINALIRCHNIVLYSCIACLLYFTCSEVI